MSTNEDHNGDKNEGNSRKDAAHALVEARRDVLIRRARRALLQRLLDVGTATADDVAERLGPTERSMDRRWLCAVPGPLAIARIIRRAGYTKSARPIRHTSVIAVWELADRAGALAWLARNPDMPEGENGDGVPCLATSKQPSPAPLAVAVAQPNLFRPSLSPSGSSRWARRHSQGIFHESAKAARRYSTQFGT
jgi:hypothetical protein